MTPSEESKLLVIVAAAILLYATLQVLRGPTLWLGVLDGLFALALLGSLFVAAVSLKSNRRSLAGWAGALSACVLLALGQRLW